MAWSTGTQTRFAGATAGPALPSWTGAAVVALVGCYAAAFGWAMANSSYDMWGGLIIGPVLVMISLPFLRRAGRRELDPRIGQLLIAALILKLLASLARYYVAFHLYEGQADANAYHQAGIAISEEFRQGDFTIDLGQKVIGTGFVELLTGGIYTITGPTLIGGYLVFAWIGFWGLYACFRAFAVAFHDQERYRYAALLFLMPSMLFWPSGIGKDTWMLLTIGVFAYGAARLFAQQRGAYLLMALGAGGQILVRPHITAIAVAALVIAYVIRRRPVRLAALGPIKSVLTWAILGLATLLVIGQVLTFFGSDSFSTEAATTVLSETERRTGQGGSAIEFKEDSQPTVTLNPSRLPWLVVTVLYRPFPQEAHNFQALMAAAEGAFLLVLTVVAWRRLLKIPGRLRRDPYVAWCAGYVVLFCYAFGHIQNFGILTRERVMVFPFVFVLLALPRRDQERSDSP